jgi:hypothetical protein
MFAVATIFAVNNQQYSYISLGLGFIGIVIMVCGWVFSRTQFQKVISFLDDSGLELSNM